MLFISLIIKNVNHYNYKKEFNNISLFKIHTGKPVICNNTLSQTKINIVLTVNTHI